MMTKNEKIAFSVGCIICLVLLIMGIILPMITIELNASVDAGLAKFQNDIFKTTRSILQTTQNLIERQRYLVGFLIFLFSVVTPTLKTILMVVCLWGDSNLRKKIQGWIDLISKWSMADVFVVAVFLAFLATDQSGSSSSQKVSVFGMSLNIKVLAMMKTQLHTGFYLFLCYCLTSIGLWQFMKKRLNAKQ